MKSRFFNSRCHSKRNLCHELLWCCICGKFCPFNVFWLVTDMRCVPKLKSTWDSTKNKPGLWKSYSQFQIWRPFHPGAVSSVFTMCFNFHQQHTPKSNKFGTHTGKWNLIDPTVNFTVWIQSNPPPRSPKHTHMQCTLLKSSLVALISFQVLFSSWMQMQKNSSKERSCVKNMGWKSWQFSLAVDTKKGKGCHLKFGSSLNETW